MIEFILYIIIACVVFTCYLLIGYRFFGWSSFMNDKRDSERVGVYIAGCIISGFWPITIPIATVCASLFFPFYWAAGFTKKLATKYNW